MVRAAGLVRGKRIKNIDELKSIIEKENFCETYAIEKSNKPRKYCNIVFENNIDFLNLTLLQRFLVKKFNAELNGCATLSVKFN